MTMMSRIVVADIGGFLFVPKYEKKNIDDRKERKDQTINQVIVFQLLKQLV